MSRTGDDMKRLTVCFACLFVVLWSGAAFAKTSDWLSYDDFIRALDTGRVKSVCFDGYSGISGTQVVNGVDQPFESYVRTGAANDPLLSRLLKEKGVFVTVRDKSSDQSPWAGLLMLILTSIPSVGALILMVLVYRRVKLLGPQKPS